MNTTLKLHGIVFVLAAFLAGATAVGVAQTAVTKPVGYYQFPFPPGADLVGQVENDGKTWQPVGPAGQGIKIGQGSLSIPSLAPSSGNHARLAGVAGPGARIALPEPLNSGSIYYSMVLQVPELGELGPGSGTIAGLSDQAGPSDNLPGLGARLVIRAVDGGFLLGVGKTATDANYLMDLVPSTVWNDPGAWFRNRGLPTDVGLIVIRYTFKPGADNDEVALWINPPAASFGLAIPPEPELITSFGPDWQQFSAFTLAQQTSPPMPALTLVDEVRIGTTWASVTPPATALIGYRSGSDGSYGPLDITADTTIPLPPDGIINATTINVGAGATLRFEKNAKNTPVYLLATKSVQINGVIDAAGHAGTATTGGEGGPGGFPGGMPPSVGVPPGDGQGPGGGRYAGGRGSSAAHQGTPDPNIASGGDGQSYGHPLLIPPTGGSGGSAHEVGGVDLRGGGGGGGAILVAAGESIVVGIEGVLLAKGGDGAQANAGSGGSIRLVAPTVSGGGTLSVRGGGTWRGDWAQAGAGWIRIDRLNREPLSLQYAGANPSLGSMMTVSPNPPPQLTIDSVDGTTIDPTSGPVTIIRSPDAPSNFNVVVKARDFRALVPTQLYIVPDNAPRSVLKATIDNTSPGVAGQQTFNVSLPPNIRSTLQVFAGKSLPPNP